MEITNEIKAKVFAQYLDHKFKYDGSIGEKRLLKGITWTFSCQDENGDSFRIDKSKLILRPLASITDEEAIEIATTFGTVKGDILINRPSDPNDNECYFTVQVYTHNPKYTTYSLPKKWSNGYGTKLYQYLQLKGFDLPHYLLGDRTLKEAGLAIYEN